MHIKDHLGNSFSSMQAMAKAYNMSFATLSARLKTMSLEQTLTTPVRGYHSVSKDGAHPGKQCIGESGEVFSSISKMCRTYGFSRTFYHKYSAQGLTISEMLKIHNKSGRATKKKEWAPSHNYSTVKDMCEAHNINRSTYENRMRKGIPQEDALKPKIMKYTDHLGNQFSTEKEMCDFHGIKFSCYRGRVKNWGRSDIKRLLSPPRKNSRWGHD